MKLAAATAVAECVSPADLAPEYIGPRIFHLGGLRNVAEAVENAAIQTGVARSIVLPGAHTLRGGMPQCIFESRKHSR